MRVPAKAALRGVRGVSRRERRRRESRMVEVKLWVEEGIGDGMG